MAGQQLVECSFLIPLRRDKTLSNGRRHRQAAWDWLDRELFTRFGGVTRAPGAYAGTWRNPRTGEPVQDESYRFFVALPVDHLPELRQLLVEACREFAQYCIYLSVGGRVEFPGSEAASDVPP